MSTTIENLQKTVNVRLTPPEAIHERIRKVRGRLSAEQPSDITILGVYMKAIELGLNQLEKAA